MDDNLLLTLNAALNISFAIYFQLYFVFKKNDEYVIENLVLITLAFLTTLPMLKMDHVLLTLNPEIIHLLSTEIRYFTYISVGFIVFTWLIMFFAYILKIHKLEIKKRVQFWTISEIIIAYGSTSTYLVFYYKYLDKF